MDTIDELLKQYRALSLAELQQVLSISHGLQMS